MEFASTVVERGINFVLDLTIRQVAYIVCYRQNVDELKDSVNGLGLERETLKHQVDNAHKNLQNIEDKVTEWDQKVGEFQTKVDEFDNDEGHRKTRLFNANGLFAYLRNRHRLGRQAKKMTVDVKKLIEESSKFNEVAYQENVTSIDAILSNASYVEFGSRKSTMEKIMAKLEDSTVRMVGLHGPAGVGKSTLIKQIARKARDKKLFSVVVIVEITANPNPQKIQEEIAYVLGLRLEGIGETVRADCLQRRFKQEKENILVILDDLWDRLDLNMLGIPLDDDTDAEEMSNFKQEVVEKQDNRDADMSKRKNELGFPHDEDDDSLRKMISNDNQDLNSRLVQKEKPLGNCKGCKILLTSRDKKVLSDKMDVKPIFCVKELDDKDALMLFQNEARIADKMSNSKQEIVKKYCAGLPMAIVTVGRALRNKSESVWQKTLDKLKNQELVEVQKSMEISVRMSYEHLENEELKSIFLLCAQMGHQPLIMDLVKYCFGLGILGGIYSLREARERIHTSILKLKDSSLMLDGGSSTHFNMHDMVRDAALSIAHEKNVFTLRNGRLDDWPELERCTSISICNSDIIDELPEVINCPQLKFFQIDSDDPSLKVPDSFFEGMKKLRVLILTGIHLRSLPCSIKCLSNLRLLCLERCTLDGDLSIIGELKKLRILSFSGSQIENLPAELGCLEKLQLLDISNCSIVKMIAPNSISRLTSLEELYIRKSLIKMFLEGETNQSQISFLSELKQLHRLKVVDLWIPSAAVLPKDLFFDELNDYKIVIGDFKMLSVGDFRMPNKYEAFRSLALQLKHDTDIHSQKGIKLLFKGVENLLLGDLNDVQNVIYELNLDGFPDLKNLSITNNFSIKYIVNSVDLSRPQDVFPNLQSLCLYQLSDIQMICCSPVTNVSFSKLKTIKVKMCAQLMNLFSFYMVKFLASLESIDVSECDSLKEIVEILVNSEKVEFLKLRSLTLQLLPSCTSFYTTVEGRSVPQLAEAHTTNRDHIEITIAEDKAPLFGELVEIPNLESLNLSSINIDKIWSDQPLSSVCYQNLTKLVVKDCYKLRYLCPLSVASGLKKLKGLFVSGCRMIEKIFEAEGDSAHKVCVFPKLEEIHLSEMNMLTNIWQAEAIAAGSFSSLISLHVESCEKIDKILPSHLEGWFSSLDSLRVVNCKSVEVIFEIKDSQQIDGSGGIYTNLQHILVQKLPNLKQVWSRDPGGILNFNKLQSIRVYYCEKLKNVFPAFVAKYFQKLETMVVHGCRGMVEIVAREDGSETNSEPLVFPELTYMVLFELSNIKHFCGGRHTIECPKLKRLVVDGCKKLQTFQAETSETTSKEEKPVFSAEKVIPKLEYMHIGHEEQKWLANKVEKYRMHSLKDLGLRSVKSVELLYQFLYRMPNLEKLNLTFSHLLEVLVPSANIAPQVRLGTVLQLKQLLVWFSGIKDLGFEHDPVLQRLKFLSLKGCNRLINLAPPSVSWTYLIYLEVIFCRGLINLMASSTAKSLVQLKTMKVIRCKVKEIITNEGNEEDKVIEVVFSNLITLELVGLEYLTSFCSYKNCEFKFPSLELLIVRECPMMETFTKSHTRAPKLQNILAVEGGGEEAKWQWEGDVNATIQKVFKDKDSFTHTKYLNVSDNDNHETIDHQQVWHCNHLLVQQNNFHNLKGLHAYRCNSLVHVIPSHLLPYFENLEELRVIECRAAQVIFNINEIRVTKALGIIRLKKLLLSGLPELEHVCDKDPEGIIGLQVLQDMRVENCDCLKSLLPASVAKDLNRLEVLWVRNCSELVEIFSKDEKAAEGATKEFVFGSLTSLRLGELPGLKYFYPGLHTLEWPVLEELDVFHCELVKFQCQEVHPEDHNLIQIEKLAPNLQHLTVGENELKMIWRGEFQGTHLHNLKVLTLLFHGLSTVLPCGFLEQVPSIEKLVVIGESSYKTYGLRGPNVEETGLLDLSQMKVLRLESLIRLITIGLENSWNEPFFRNLETLQVGKCSGLRNLAPPPVCFPNLMCLFVFECHGLENLFTSSAAKSLAQLKRMEIKSCRSIEEIVSKEGDESHENEIIFQQLKCLNLEKLPYLRSFYKGSLSFPSLDQLSVINCNRMKTLCAGTINADKLLGVQFHENSDAIPLEVDLNSTLQKAFLVKLSESARSVSDLYLADSPPLQEIWHGSQPIPDLCFSNLQSLTVYGCQFLSDAVLPFNLLPFLTKLEKLEVKNCDSVKTIFDVKGITQGIITTFPMKKLTLGDLPKLENVWNQNPDGILSMQLLQKVSVDNCKCLTSVFPASVANDLVKLEKLAVEDCEELMEIVAEDNADSRGAKLELTFPCPCVRSLELQGLPKFKYFYYCLPQCDIEKTYRKPHAEDEVCLKKPTSNLQCLSLGEKGLEMIKRGEFQRNLLDKLQVLTLCLESDEFPYEILQQVPNIEKLVVCDGLFKEIFCLQSPNVDDIGLLLQLKVLHLESLEELVSIGLEKSCTEPFLRNLETLQVISCFELKNLAPCTVSFSNLTYLEVQSCTSLLYLFTSSTAKSLGQLKRLEIKGCDSIQEIVSKEGDESHKNEQIILEQLQVLNLEELHQLKCFYPGNFTLHFPCLEQVYIINCRWMKTFSPVNKIDHSTEWFSAANDATPQQECDLNLAVRRTFEKTFLKSARSVFHLDLADSPLQEIWHGSLPIPDFSMLRSFTVDGCQFLLDAVLPFTLLPLFRNLEILYVRNCHYVRTIFGVKCTSEGNMMSTGGPAPSPLKKLTLSKLPNLENVWNEDPDGILRMQLLQKVSVINCKCLKSVFPASVAKDLMKLQNLVVKDCEELMAIVAEDNADPRGSNLELTFPRLKSLELRGLPKVTYNGICYIRDSTTTFELTPNLQHLTLGENELKMILRGEFQGNYLSKLKDLTLFFHIESNVFLQRVPNLEELVVRDGVFKETFRLPELKVLPLESLGELVSIGSENSWIVPFLRNLETLEVITCFSSINLVPCTVSFSNLTYLEIDSCHSLQYLFTSSTVISLAQLKTMKVKWCDSIEEIVSKEGDDSNDDEIIFQQLNCLKLKELPKLGSFYKGSLSFPSLDQLSLIDCDKMETLCAGTIKADKLFGVKFHNNSDAIPLEIDLNSTMRKAFQATAKTTLLP